MRGTFNWYRERNFPRYHALIGIIWYHRSRLKKLHFYLLARRGEGIPFPMGEFRHPYCADCRNDPRRQEIAAVSDRKKGMVVQEVKCKACNKIKPWWWYAKLPLSQEEVDIIQARGGKAW